MYLWRRILPIVWCRRLQRYVSLQSYNIYSIMPDALIFPPGKDVRIGKDLGYLWVFQMDSRDPRVWLCEIHTFTCTIWEFAHSTHFIKYTMCISDKIGTCLPFHVCMDHIDRKSKHGPKLTYSTTVCACLPSRAQ